MMVDTVKRLLRPALLTALVAGAFVVGSVDTAAADSRSVRDARGDVYTSINYQTKNAGWHADVSKVTLHHRRNSVAVRIDFHTLRRWKHYGVPNGIPFTDLYVVMNTPSSLYNMRLIRDPGRSESAVYKKYGDTPIDPWGRVCRLDSTINWKKDFILLKAPRRCFGKPRNIDAGVGLYGDWAAEGFYAEMSDTVRWTRKARRG